MTQETFWRMYPYLVLAVAVVGLYLVFRAPEQHGDLCILCSRRWTMRPTEYNRLFRLGERFYTLKFKLGWVVIARRYDPVQSRTQMKRTKELPRHLAERYMSAYDAYQNAKAQLEATRDEVLPFFENGSICPDIGTRTIVYTTPERTTWSWKDQYIILQAERKYGIANKANIAKATKFALKLQDKAPKNPCPTLNVVDKAAPAKKGNAK